MNYISMTMIMDTDRSRIYSSHAGSLVTLRSGSSFPIDIYRLVLYAGSLLCHALVMPLSVSAESITLSSFLFSLSTINVKQSGDVTAALCNPRRL